MFAKLVRSVLPTKAVSVTPEIPAPPTDIHDVEGLPTTSIDQAPPLRMEDELYPDVDAVLREIDDIGALVEREYSTLELADEQQYPGFHVGLAPLYGELAETARHLMAADIGLHLAMKATIALLATRSIREMKWEDIIKLLVQNPALEEEKGKESRHCTQLLRPKRSHLPSQEDFGVDRKVDSWFEQLVPDENVRKATKINTQVLKKIVARSEVVIDKLSDSPMSFISKTEHMEETLLDIGFLRFPHTSDPHFTVYRIHLKAWARRKLMLNIFQTDKSGIEGTYVSREFRPCREILDQLVPMARREAIAGVETLIAAPC